MLNLTGAFVVIRETRVEAHILNDTAYRLFMDRISVAGSTKANVMQFGTDTLYALPCVTACMEYIALNYTGIHAQQVKAVCARIALGQPPMPNHANDDIEGGLGVVADINKPKKPQGGTGAKVKARPAVTADSLAAMLSG